MNVSLVRSALDALGPDRVRQGMRAFDIVSEWPWDDCFLARCYGESGALHAEMRERVGLGPACVYGDTERFIVLTEEHFQVQCSVVARLLGIPHDAAEHVIACFDNAVDRVQLWQVCTAWLREQDAIERVIAESATEEVCCA